MYQTLKNLIVAVTITVLLYSCTMANSNSFKEPEFSNVNYTNMSIGDTLIFSPEYIANNNDLSADGINGRRVIFRDHELLARVTEGGSGRIYVNTCINQAGESVFVSIDQKNTTIKDKGTLSNALKMVAGYRFEKDTTANQYECGMIKLFLDINAFR